MRISDWSSDVCSSDLLGRRLHDDEGHVMAGERPLEALDAVAVVGDAQVPVERVEVDVETVFTHVDADIDWLRASFFGQDLALHAGLAPSHLFRTGAKDGRTRLSHGRSEETTFELQ